MRIEQRRFGLVAVLAIVTAGWVVGSESVFAASKAAAADPIGDTFGTGAHRVDVIGFSAASEAGELAIRMSFAEPISPPDSGRNNAISGFVDIDLDRDSATGDRPFVEFLTGLEADLGIELYIPLLTYSSADGQADLVGGSGDVIGRVPLSWPVNAMEIRIPHSLIGSGRIVHTAAIVGTLEEATDAVPDSGSIASTGPPLGDPVLLNGDRFRVELVWSNFDGGSGNGQLAVRSEDSAVFYFYDALNWEVLVKVLDACNFNGFYWVFAAATTNLEYALTITDTETGLVRQYTNPLGVASPAVTDTSAFATCP